MEMFAKVTCFAMLCMIMVAPHAEAAISCGQVSSALGPCLPYLKSGGAIASNCCSGVRGLKSAAKSTLDRQAACSCLKSLANSISSINDANAASLPGKCGVSIPYKISRSVDCSKVV
ncbi:hypothetical protein Leryth_002909 [Lithospermum erythrorhizon]|nr:hypothetical protein Leryth_002909 [Lithospermum erythrorhizon]